MPPSFRIAGSGASLSLSLSLILTAFVAIPSAIACEKREEQPPQDAGSPPATSQAPSARVGEPASVSDLTVTVEEVDECAPRAYERGAVEQAGAALLGVRLSIARAEATGSEPPAQYEGAPRMLLEDGQGRQYRYTLRGTCTPELRGANLRAGGKLRGWATFQIPTTAKDLTLVYPVDAQTHGQPAWVKEPGVARGAAPHPPGTETGTETGAVTGAEAGAETGATSGSQGPVRFSLGR